MSGKVLEAAYLWTLGCAAASAQPLTFNEHCEVPFRCQGICAGRIFPSVDDRNFDLSKKNVKPGILYYANEGGGLPSHPRGDLFFRGDDGRIVVIDVTGGGLPAARRKVRKLHEWLTQHVPSKQANGILCIVLAPLAESVELHDDAGVVLVSGKDAVDLLGGLAQIVSAFREEDDEET